MSPGSAEPVDASSSGKAQPSARRGRVLVIEDEPLVSETMRHILAREHDVTVIHDPGEALQALREPAGAFDVVLCD
jgi:CheY-like chemotaxis protein